MPVDVVPVISTGLSVIPGQSATFRCNDTLKIFNTSKLISLNCGNDGNFVAPAAWPACRLPANCTSPTAPTSTHLKLATSSPATLYEFDYAVYNCVTGYTLAGVTPNNLTFEVICPYGGGAITVPTWPTCLTTTTGRKKRYVDYKSIYTDIDYTVLALFETQFMHTK